jgi:hypothetical protein
VPRPRVMEAAGVPDRHANRELLDCCRDLTEQSRKLDTSLGTDALALSSAVSVLLQELALTLAAEPEGTAIVTGRTLWTDAAPQLQDRFMSVGKRALGTQPEISLRIADAVLAARPNSRAAWRLRALALEELGELSDAIDAHEAYLSRITSDTIGAGQNVVQLRRRLAATRELADALGAELAGAEAGSPTAGTVDLTGPADLTGDLTDDLTDTGPEELWDAGFRLEHSGDWPAAKARYVAATRLLVTEGAAPRVVVSAVDQLAAKTAHHEHDHISDSLPLLTSLATYGRAGDTALMDADAATGLDVIGIGDFRNLVAGRSICLVANSERVAKGRWGRRIDEYDLVVRFNSYAIDPAATGRRTDIHATIHLHDFNWDKKVAIRLVFSGSQNAWLRSLKQRLVPGAQDHVGDGSLRWPVRDARYVDDQEIPGIPTSGFNMLRLLDHLDVNPVIDLVGFDFYETGPYRLKEAMGLAVSPQHAYQYEKAWVLTHATSSDEMRISLR